MARQFKMSIARVRAITIVALPSPLSSNNSNQLVDFVMTGFPRCGATTPKHLFDNSSAMQKGIVCGGRRGC
jgi:hypothetical protein